MSNPQTPLTSVRARFHTASDDKDADTKLTITIARGADEFAILENITGLFPDHSENGPFALNLLGPVTRGDLQPDAFMRLGFVAVGNDTWQFNAFLELEYGDGSRQQYQWFNKQLKENAGIIALPFQEGIP